MQINLSKSKKHLVFTETTFDQKYGFAVGQKRAALPIDPSKAPEEVLQNAEKFVWEISGTPTNDGWSPVVRPVATIDGEELEKELDDVEQELN